MWAHLGQKEFELKMKNAEPVRVSTLGSIMPLSRMDGNTFQGMGFNKGLIKQFIEYFLHEVKSRE